jgi:hypothetical protein
MSSLEIAQPRSTRPTQPRTPTIPSTNPTPWNQSRSDCLSSGSVDSATPVCERSAVRSRWRSTADDSRGHFAPRLDHRRATRSCVPANGFDRALAGVCWQPDRRPERVSTGAGVGWTNHHGRALGPTIDDPLRNSTASSTSMPCGRPSPRSSSASSAAPAAEVATIESR